ncbi:MAG: flagellar motor switch protein FliN [Woeseiaceae bacterium]
MANDVPGSATGAAGAAAGQNDAGAGGQYSPEPLQGNKAKTAPGSDVNLDLVLDVPVNVSLRVGSTDLSIRDLVKLVEGSVIALDRQADEAMDVLVNGTLIAHGEIVVVDDRFGVRLTDVVSPAERIQKIN